MNKLALLLVLAALVSVATVATVSVSENVNAASKKQQNLCEKHPNKKQCNGDGGGGGGGGETCPEGTFGTPPNCVDCEGPCLPASTTSDGGQIIFVKNNGNGNYGKCQKLQKTFPEELQDFQGCKDTFTGKPSERDGGPLP